MPATAKGILALLDHHGVELAGRRAVVVGRSELVGRPVATLFNQRDSTVTVCHSRSRDLEQECRRADVLIAAAGRPHLIGEAHVRRGAIVIDVGIHRGPRASTGDVDYEAVRRRAGAVSPVPGRRRPDDDRLAAREHPRGRAHQRPGRGRSRLTASGHRDARSLDPAP